MSPARRALTVAAAAFALAVPLSVSGCASASTATGASETTAATQDAAGVVAFTDGWAKANEGMTGVFGTIENLGDEPLVLEGATSTAAEVVELHESVTNGDQTSMQEVDGGFEIPPGDTFELAPGGFHIMLMELHEELLPGDEVTLTLLFGDGSEQQITVLVKDTEGARENYADGAEDEHGGAAHGEHEGHEHGTDDGH